MNQEIKQRWIQALRSGEYEQGEGGLFHCGKFCCLGVLTDLYIKEHGFQWKQDSADLWSFEDERETLPQSVQDWSGIDAPDPMICHSFATDLNDYHDASFEDIAVYIAADKEL
jgi:hypothetical protein